MNATATTTPAASKPNWARRPDPGRKSAHAASPDAIDALIQKQTERATGEPKPAATPAAKAPVKHISLNMDSALHKRLKHYCVIHERNVSELLGDLAEKFLATQSE